MSYPHKTNIDYKGLTIEVNYDQTPQNPFEDWDGCVPMIVVYDRHRKDYSDGQIIEYLRNYLSYNQVRRNQTKLIKLMEFDVEDYKSDLVDELDKTEIVQDDLWTWLNESISNMAKFCEAFGIKYLKKTSTGYSQSDWADTFFCWTPEFGEVTGRTYEAFNEDDLNGAFDLYTNWAWGDVYGYNIDDEDGNHVGSCWGFYGDDWDKNGLMEHATSDINCYLDRKRRSKQSKLKTLIKNHVPLSKRTPILQAV